jgi:hypothetical protein
MIKIHVDSFRANDPDKTLEDFIQDIQAGSVKDIVNVHFKTTDKYYRVVANGSTLGPDYSGSMIEVYPYLYSENGKDLYEEDWERYYDHPKFFRICLVVEGVWNGVSSMVTALKHEYFVSFVPDHLVMNYDCLAPIELIEYED